MVGMRTFKVLFKKGLRDFVSNLKQFITIIFIIAISSTLYVGLEANTESLESRVNQIYSEENGNLADIWVTINPEMDDLNSDKMDVEKEKIKELSGPNSEVETRLLLPSAVYGNSVNGLISYEKPTINKAYNLHINTSLATDSIQEFFYIDKETARKASKELHITSFIGEEATVSLDSSYLSGFEDTILSYVDPIYDFALDFVSSTTELEDDIKDRLTQYLETYRDDITDSISTHISDYFDENTSIDLNAKITGLMDHPENAQSGEFNTTNFLMGYKTLLISLSKTILNNINYKTLSEIILENVENEATRLLLDEYLKQYEDDINEMVPIISNYMEYSIRESEDDNVSTLLNRVYNQYIIKVDENYDVKEVQEAITEYFNFKTEDDELANSTLIAILDRDSYPSCSVLTNDIAQSRQMTLTFPIIFFVVSLLVVLTTITQMILKERTQIGTLKALGLAKGKILLYYLSLFNFVAFIGVALGLIIGPILIPLVMNIKYQLLYSIPDFSYVFPYISAIIILLVVLVLISALTILLIYSELRSTPASSMRPKAPKINYEKKKENKIIKNTSLMMAFRNIRVHFAKSLMVVIGVMGCTGLLICGFGIEDTLDEGINIDIVNILGADLSTNYSGNVLKDTIRGEIEAVEGIDSVYEFAALQVTAGHEDNNSSEMLYYFDQDTINFKYASWEPTELDNEGNIVYNCGLSQSIADDIDAKKGDTITVIFNNNNYEFHVSEVFFTFAARAVYVYRETIDLVNYSNSTWINVIKNEDGSWARSEKDLKDEILKIKGVASVVSQQDNINRVNSYMSSIRYMTTTVKAFAIALAVVVLINLAILNYQERLREIATLKVLGFSRREIASSLVYESSILTVIGSIFGMFIGLPLEYMVLGANETKLVAWSYAIYRDTYVIALVISAIVGIIVNVLISSRINKVMMAESLKSVE